jgi:[ribosomal protein S18]-alanine N-acetyltransferase
MQSASPHAAAVQPASPRTHAACALAQERRVSFIPMTAAHVPVIAELEKAAYTHPWTRTNLQDAVLHHNHAQLLVSEPLPGELATWHTAAGEVVVGYFVAMMGVDEAHLLNITVAPQYRRQGWATVMLQALAVWAQSHNAQTLWLEVRQSNEGAKALYRALQFEDIGVRKRYYPLNNQAREDAQVMRLPLADWRMPK